MKNALKRVQKETIMEYVHHENIFEAVESTGHDLEENTHSKEMKNGRGPSAPQSAVIQSPTEVITVEDAERAVVVYDHEVMEAIGCPYVSGSSAPQSAVIQPLVAKIITEEAAERAVVVVDHEVMEAIGCPSVSDQATGENGLQEMMTAEPALNDVEMKSDFEVHGVAEMEFSSTPENLEIMEPETDGVQALDCVRSVCGSTNMATIWGHVGRRKTTLLPWQEDAIQKAIEDCNRGMRISQAARYHNISASTLRGRMKNISPRVSRRCGPVQEDAVRKAMEDYNQGSSLVAALNRYDVPVSTLYDRLKSGPQKGTLNKHKRRGTPALEDAIRDYDRGCTVKLASARNGVSERTLRYRLKKRLDSGVAIRSEQTVDVQNRRIHAEEASSIRSEAVQDVESRKRPQRTSKQRCVHENALKVVKKVPWTASAMKKALAEVGRGSSVTSASERHGIPLSTLRDHVHAAHSSKKASLCSTPIRKSLSPVIPSEDDIQKAIEDVDSGLHMSPVAVMYNIPHSTFADRLDKRTNEQGTLSRTRSSVKQTKGFGKASSNTVPVRWGATSQHSNLKNMGSCSGKNTLRPSRNPKWSEKDMLRALNDVKKGIQISRAARINGIPSGTLHSRIKRTARMSRKVQNDEAPDLPLINDQSVRKPQNDEAPDLPLINDQSVRKPQNDEASDLPLINDQSVRKPSGQEQLVQYIKTLASFGFIPGNDDELLEAVKDFVATKDVCVSLGNSALDGDWLSGFLAQNDPVMKISRMMSSCQKTNPGSSNPFVVYSFYDALEQISTAKKLESNQIWTCCEAGFPNNPHKVKERVRFDVGAEHSTTCLIACGGAGQVMDPFIIYPERVDRATLRGSVILPGTSHAVSDNGCMAAAVFDNWFGCFTNLVKQRPLVLIVDSQLTYLSVGAIEKAASEHIFLMKIPCNTPDVLQPLWQFCFAQFASKWKTAFTEWLENHDNDEQMSKADFAEQLCSVWHECLSQEDITAGFESTGVFPVNRTQFPVNKLDNGLLRLHAVWLAAGKPEHMAPDIPTFYNPTVTASSLPSIRATRSASQPVPLDFNEDYNQEEEVSPHGHVQTASGDASAPTPPDSTSGAPFPICWCRSPPAHIPGKKWVPTWTLLDDVEVPSNSSTRDSS